MTLVSIPANPVPDGAVSGMLKTRDGISLRFARWPAPPGRKGTVCLFPGRAEFIEKYFETVRDLRARGFAVAALDWRGQGGSSGYCGTDAKVMSAASRNTRSTLKPSFTRSSFRIVPRQCLRSPIRWGQPSFCVRLTQGIAGLIAWCCLRQ